MRVVLQEARLAWESQPSHQSLSQGRGSSDAEVGAVIGHVITHSPFQGIVFFISEDIGLEK